MEITGRGENTSGQRREKSSSGYLQKHFESGMLFSRQRSIVLIVVADIYRGLSLHGMQGQ